ncbi:MAG: hypothetical protein HC806_00340 [Anaerolineae bacterium]|nr:hypothetical protein [Anaerolineae bacterium]
MSDADAKNNLRQALSNLRKFLSPYLIVTRDTVQFNGATSYSIDVDQFTQEIKLSSPKSPSSLSTFQTALALYKGDFLQGFFIREAPEFEDWAYAERVRLRELALQALHRLAEIEMSHADYPAALETTTRLLAFDPWREETHRQRMIALARMGQRSAALAQYQACRRILEKELGVEPTRETTKLYEQIRSAEHITQHNLPASTTSFIGREEELTEIRLQLGNPECRLLTLVGEGGVGKSRLALKAAHDQIHQFLNGVWFVPLASVKDLEGMFRRH